MRLANKEVLLLSAKMKITGVHVIKITKINRRKNDYCLIKKELAEELNPKNFKALIISKSFHLVVPALFNFFMYQIEKPGPEFFAAFT